MLNPSEFHTGLPTLWQWRPLAGISDAAIVLAIAALLDYLIGDPWNWLHPVQIMGWGIQRYCHIVLKRWHHPLALKGLGVVLAIALPSLSGLVVWVVVLTAQRLHPFLGMVTEAILLASCFAGRSLRRSAQDVLKPLMAGDLAIARTQLSLYVGRDTANLSKPEILRAVLETVTENATDGVVAPLLYAILGAFLPLGSAPLAMAYKASSTLDSMVGYREAPYTYLGWGSARLEDALTWIPCRLNVLLLSLLSGQPHQVWQICRRDAPHDPSPNAGWSECAYAAILGVQVGGANQYKGVTKLKPLLGDATQPITAQTIDQAMNMTRMSFLIWMSIALATLTIWSASYNKP
ncbi:MAG: adenosylcobinamide-phosphate synthase CbiB [Timaviella obliquedivisa GSE-PSE-MK23-08B]|jgi:adenosylcobinamide-phosphate synthase|nr:adenosylcobinamide-phosphate synthase CbiB [Timaviella obliquedivisa GSE-PSE-MK23-08B]